MKNYILIIPVKSVKNQHIIRILRQLDFIKTQKAAPNPCFSGIGRRKKKQPAALIDVKTNRRFFRKISSKLWTISKSYQHTHSWTKIIQCSDNSCQNRKHSCKKSNRKCLSFELNPWKISGNLEKVCGFYLFVFHFKYMFHCHFLSSLVENFNDAIMSFNTMNIVRCCAFFCGFRWRYTLPVSNKFSTHQLIRSVHVNWLKLF